MAVDRPLTDDEIDQLSGNQSGQSASAGMSDSEIEALENKSGSGGKSGMSAWDALPLAPLVKPLYSATKTVLGATQDADKRYPIENTLPAAGATLGGLLGGGLTVPLSAGTAMPFGATIGAGFGGSGGEAARQIIARARGNSAPSTPMEALKGIGVEGGTAAAGELGGAALIKGGGKALRWIGQRAADWAGLRSGAQGAVEEAYNAGRQGGAAKMALKETMSGEGSEMKAVNDAKAGLQQLKDNRATDYVNLLQKVKESKAPIDLGPILQSYDNQIASFSRGARDTLSEAEKSELQKVENLLLDWGSKHGDDTALGLDTLKQQLDNLYSANPRVQKIMTGVRNTIKSQIESKVPQYAAMTKGYEEASNLLRDVNSELSLGKGKATGTTLRKLQQTLRQNFEYRKALVSTLDEAGGGNTVARIAGMNLQQSTPRGLARLVATGVQGPLAVGATIMKAPYLVPFMLADMASSSPRLAGEAAQLIGSAARRTSGARATAAKVPWGQIATQLTRQSFKKNEE